MRLLITLGVATIGLIHTVARRWSMNPDGISYLDIADRYAAGDWGAALNATWSPALSWVLAGVFRVFQPHPSTEFTVTHFTLFAVYLLAFAAFEWFLRELTPDRRPWYWYALAYAVFLWSTLFLVDLQEVTPDMGVVALTFAAAALSLAIRRQPGRLTLWIALGVVVAAAYLTKAVMLYVGMALMLTTSMSVGRDPLRLSRVAASVLVLALVAGPWIAALSSSKGRFTTGDIGSISIGWFLNNVTPVQHWQGLPRGFGVPTHTTRQILANPHVYEFGTPIVATHPPRFDPSYWYDGVIPRLDITRMMRIAVYNIGLFGWLGAPLVLVLAGLLLTGDAVRRVRAYWFLLLPMSVGIALFVVLYLEERYIAGFLAVLYLSALAPLNEGDAAQTDRPSRALQRNACVALATFCLTPVIYETALRAIQIPGLSEEHSYWAIAQSMQQRGLRSGSPIAVIGDGQAAYWARLGRYRIVAEVPEPQDVVFWSCNETARAVVMAAIAETGAMQVIALGLPGWANPMGWTPVTPGGPLISADFQPQARAAGTVPVSYLDRRDLTPCSPKRL